MFAITHHDTSTFTFTLCTDVHDTVLPGPASCALSLMVLKRCNDFAPQLVAQNNMRLRSVCIFNLKGEHQETYLSHEKYSDEIVKCYVEVLIIFDLYNGTFQNFSMNSQLNCPITVCKDDGMTCKLLFNNKANNKEIQCQGFNEKTSFIRHHGIS